MGVWKKIVDKAEDVVLGSGNREEKKRDEEIKRETGGGK